jgi:hypothetical protein
MNSKLPHPLLIALFLLLSAPLLAAPLQEAEIPEPLKPWQSWVSWPHRDLDCPFLSSGEERRCIWADQLELDLAETSGSFTYRISLFNESQVALPGSIDHWPRKVQVDGSPGVLLEQQGRPVVRIAPGRYRISGEFHWRQLPDTLKIPEESGIVALRLNGKPVAHPLIKQGRLWLKTQAVSDAGRQPEERVDLRVFRLLDDNHPFTLETELALQISGAQRELTLGRPLLAGFIPARIESQLPAKLEANGELRIQVRPGSWRVRLIARHVAPVSSLESTSQPAPWPTEEIWALRARHQLRVVEVSGPPQIDPRQVDLPEAWSNLPAYRLKPGETLILQEVRRANQEPEPDQLTLQRDIWLDFNARGYTLQDHITGTITSSWRLSADPALQLGRVALNGVPQFITRLPDTTLAGVEVRRGDLDLLADLRVAREDRLPASGWRREFRQIATTLHLPPGWRLLAVSGVDNLPQSWLQQWTLYDLFLVLIAGIAAGRLWGWLWTLPTLLTLALTWHEPLAPQMVWLYLLAAIALSRVAPAGRMQQWLRGLRLAGYLALVLILVPFAVNQARLGLHPQLERYGTVPDYSSTITSRGGMMRDDEMAMPGMAKEPSLSAPSKLLQRQRVERYRVLDEVDPNALVQTGPGLPAWDWNRFHLAWNGPVAEEQNLGLYLLSPWQTSLWRFLTIGLVLLTAWRMLDRERRLRLRLPRASQLLLAGLALSLPMSDKALAEIPDQPLLKELERRLTLPPECLPECVSIQQMRLNVAPEAYRAELAVHALEATGIPLPVDVEQLTPLRVTLDGDQTARLVRLAHQLWLYVPKGLTQVEMTVGLPPLVQAQIPLPLRPHHVQIEETRGWRVGGLDREGQTGSQLSLIRLRDEPGQQPRQIEFGSGNALPPFFRVERTLHLGNSWSMTSRLLRQTPTGSPVTLQLPLLAGESVISEGIQVREGVATLSLTANQQELSWQSNLQMSEQIPLTAAQTDRWVEVWSVDVGPIWHLSAEGIPPVLHQDKQGNWLPTWQPWPGEGVVLSLVRPEGIEGNTITIDRSRLSIEPGQRITHQELSLSLRASRGGQHPIQLPETAELQSVDIDGRRVTLGLEQGRLTLPVTPGEQAYTIIWRQPRGMSTRWRSSPLSLGIDSVNAHIGVKLPPDRWLLWADGPRLGPAILFWSLLIVVLLVALILGRVTRLFLPLSTLSWFLLGIGLTQVSLFSGLAVVAWFLLLHYRSKLDPQVNEPLFNLVQTGVVVLTLIFIAILFWSVQQGLLGYPSMQVEGNDSSAYRLNWYQDRLDEAFPQVGVISVPLLIYRALMLAWALWLAFSLLSWLKWGWAAFSKGGIYWKRIKIDLGPRRRPRKGPPATTQKGSEPG